MTYLVRSTLDDVQTQISFCACDTSENKQILEILYTMSQVGLPGTVPVHAPTLGIALPGTSTWYRVGGPVTWYFKVRESNLSDLPGGSLARRFNNAVATRKHTVFHYLLPVFIIVIIVQSFD